MTAPVSRARGRWAGLRGSSWPDRGRPTLAALAAFVVLIAFMMWPQVRHMTDRATEHQDVYFNMWRLAWIAHALGHDPRHAERAS